MSRLPTLIILVLVLAGGAYGYFSAKVNANPYPTTFEEGMPKEDAARIADGKAWRPSPLWLPSYLVAQWPSTREYKPGHPKAGQTEKITGYGLTRVNDGGYSMGPLQRHRYEAASAAVGAAMGLIIGVIITLATGMVSIRKERPRD